MNQNDEKYNIYIDESGIIAKDGHSVYVLVYIDYLNESRIGEKIFKIEKDLKISHIHWVSMSNKVRIRVSKKIRHIDFSCEYVVYKNPISQRTALQNVLIELLKSQNKIFKIIIDGESSRKNENALKSVLKNRGIKVYNIVSINDKKDSILRLADFMAGLIRSCFDNKGRDNIYAYELLKHKTKRPD